MIYSPHGEKVRILSINEASGNVTCLRGIQERIYHFSQLRADNGIDEIRDAVNLLKRKQAKAAKGGSK